MQVIINHGVINKDYTNQGNNEIINNPVDENKDECINEQILTIIKELQELKQQVDIDKQECLESLISAMQEDKEENRVLKIKKIAGSLSKELLVNVAGGILITYLSKKGILLG